MDSRIGEKISQINCYNANYCGEKGYSTQSFLQSITAIAETEDENNPNYVRNNAH